MRGRQDVEVERGDVVCWCWWSSEVSCRVAARGDREGVARGPMGVDWRSDDDGSGRGGRSPEGARAPRDGDREVCRAAGDDGDR